jgi:hypothetical protein
LIVGLSGVAGVPVPLPTGDTFTGQFNLGSDRLISNRISYNRLMGQKRAPEAGLGE